MTRQMADDEVLRPEVVATLTHTEIDLTTVEVNPAGSPLVLGIGWHDLITLASHNAAVVALQAERDALRAEQEHNNALTQRQSDLLTGAVNVLRGDPPSDTLWSHHDVAELALEMKARAERAESALEALRGQVAGLGWIKPSDRLPEDGTECLVVAQYGSDPKPYVSVDTWQMQREAPLEFSSCTVEIGLAWDDHDFLDVLLWKPIVRPSAEELDAALLAIKERMG